ncbi:MAG: M48 family metallopeptidase [Alphaproteobacteria bacterium]
MIYAAEFNDGQTAARHSVEVKFGGTGLDIATVDGDVGLHWAYDDLRLIDPPRPHQPVRLYSQSHPDARLRLADAEFVDTLRQRAPRLFQSGLAHPNVRRNVAVVILVLAGLGLFLWQGVPLLSAPLAQLVPLEWERNIGAIVRNRVLGGAKTCAAPAGAAALSEMAKRLASALETPPVMSVTVAEGAMVNAFAMPGGHIVIFRGLLKVARSADEIAAVLAHEMGHAYHRHPTQIALRAVGIAMFTDLLTGDGSAIVELAGELGGMLLLLSYSREMERQADAFGRNLMHRAGLSTTAMAQLFARLRDNSGDRNGGGLFGYFNSHPPLDERITVGIAAEIAAGGGVSGGQPALDDARWRSLQAICG